MVLEADNKKSQVPKNTSLYTSIQSFFFSIDHGTETYTNTENKVRYYYTSPSFLLIWGSGEILTFALIKKFIYERNHEEK